MENSRKNGQSRPFHWTTVGQNINLLRNQHLTEPTLHRGELDSTLNWATYLSPDWFMSGFYGDGKCWNLFYFTPPPNNPLPLTKTVPLKFGIYHDWNALHNVSLFAQLGNSSLTTRQQMLLLWECGFLISFGQSFLHPNTMSPIRKGRSTKYITHFWQRRGKGGKRGPA